jgi:uncharacterized protein with HEPN domain
MEIELSHLLGKKVDLRTAQDLSAYFRDEVLKEAKERMQKNDKIRFQHMLDAIEEAMSFAKNKGRESLDKDRMLVLALMKDVEIVGEAASRISKEAQRSTPEIPWVNIIGMRNRLIHAYFDINLDILWQTVRNDLPELAKILKVAIDADN